MTPRQREAYEAYQRLKSKVAVAEEMGICESTVRELLIRAERYMNTDSGITSAMQDNGLSDIQNLHSGWLKTDSSSLYFQLPKEDKQQRSLEDYVDLVKEAFAEVPQALPITPPTETDSDTLTRYLFADLHFGMMAWEAEAGEDNDLEIARSRLLNAMARLVQSTPASKTAMIANLGDMFHANDQKNKTPQHGHILDVSGRFAKIALVTTRAIISCIEMAKRKHEKVIYVGVSGNHDPDQHHWLTIALMMHYENDPQVDVIWNPAKLFVRQFGNSMLALHHGDQVKPNDLVHQMSDTYAKTWGETYWRYLDTGHIHHDSSKDIGGAYWESHRTLSSRDAYATGHGYVVRQVLKAITVDRTYGEVDRSTVGLFYPQKVIEPETVML